MCIYKLDKRIHKFISTLNIYLCLDISNFQTCPYSFYESTYVTRYYDYAFNITLTATTRK